MKLLQPSAKRLEMPVDRVDTGKERMLDAPKSTT